MSQEQESQFLFTPSPPTPTEESKFLRTPSSPPTPSSTPEPEQSGSSGINILEGAAAVLQRFDSLSASATSSPLAFARAVSEDDSSSRKVKPITIKKRKSCEDLADEKRKKKTGEKKKKRKYDNSLSWEGPPPPRTFLPIRPFPTNVQPHGSATSQLNFHERAMAILRLAAFLGNAWANGMAYNLQTGTMTPPEMSQVYNIVEQTEYLINIFKK
jgi:hypothetical protein